MDFTSYSQLLRKYRCAELDPSLYALTTLFPSISRYKRTRADKQHGNSTDYPIFSPTDFHSVKWPIHRVLSALMMMALTSLRIYAPSLFFCLFVLAYCLDPHHGDNMTDVDQSFLACSYTLNDHSSTPHSPCAMLQLTCQQQTRCHNADSKRHALLSARLTLQRNYSLALPPPAWYGPSGDLLLQTILARSFLRETTVPPLFGLLQLGLGDFRLNLHIFAWRFIFVRSLQSSPDMIVCYGSILMSVSV